MSNSTDDIVTFVNGEGEEVSNDPRWPGVQALRAQERAEADAENEANLPMEEWGAARLKAEVKARNENRDDDEKIDVSGIKKKSELVELLKADDEAHADSQS